MQVAQREDAIPYDVPGVELGHHGERCSFGAFLDKCNLDDPALRPLALIVRRGDTRLRRVCQAMAKDDHDNVTTKQFPAYDPVYAHCRETTESRRDPPRADMGACIVNARSTSIT